MSLFLSDPAAVLSFSICSSSDVHQLPGEKNTFNGKEVYIFVIMQIPDPVPSVPLLTMWGVSGERALLHTHGERESCLSVAI